MAQFKLNKSIYISRLTIMATFLMGFIDAYTFIEQEGAFASAQTGNMVMLSAKLFTGEFGEAATHLLVLVAYALGAFVGEALIHRYESKELYDSRLILLLQTVLLGFLAFLQPYLNDAIILFCLGLLAGYELTVFRKFKGTTVNNGIMTGNTKNAMNNLYQALVNRDTKARLDFFHLMTVIVVFLLGAGIGTFVVKWHAQLNLWVAFSLVLISLLVTLLRKPAKQKKAARG